MKHEGPLALHHLATIGTLELGVAVPQHVTLDLKNGKGHRVTA